MLRAADAPAADPRVMKTCWIVSGNWERCADPHVERFEVVVECAIVHGPDALSTYLVIPRVRAVGLSGIEDRWVVRSEMVFDTREEAWAAVHRMAKDKVAASLRIVMELDDRHRAAMAQ